MQLWPKRNEVFRNEFTARHKALVKAIRMQNRFDAIKAEMHFHSYPYEFSGNVALLDVWHQLSKTIQLSFAMSQVIVRGVEFISTSESYTLAALGDDLDAMLREIDQHLEASDGHVNP
jgi:DNA-binding GntR family transcriptional regulator